MAEYLDQNGAIKIAEKVTSLQNELQENGYITPNGVDVVELGSLPVGGKFYLNHGEKKIEYVVVQKNNDSMFYVGDYMAAYVMPVDQIITQRVGLRRNSDGNEVDYSYDSRYLSAHEILRNYITLFDEQVIKCLRVVSIPYESRERHVNDKDETIWYWDVKYGYGGGYKCCAFLPSAYELGFESSLGTYNTSITTDGRVFELFRLNPEFRKASGYGSNATYATRSPLKSAYGDNETFGGSIICCYTNSATLISINAYLSRDIDYWVWARPIVCIDQRCPVKITAG